MNFSFFIFSISSDLWPGAENRCKEGTMPSGGKITSVCSSSQYSPWFCVAYHLPRDALCSRYNMRYPFPFFLIHPIFQIPFSLSWLHCVLSLTSVLRTRLSESSGNIVPSVKKVHFSTFSLGHSGERSSTSVLLCLPVNMSEPSFEGELVNVFCSVYSQETELSLRLGAPPLPFYLWLKSSPGFLAQIRAIIEQKEKSEFLANGEAVSIDQKH